MNCRLFLMSKKWEAVHYGKTFFFGEKPVRLKTVSRMVFIYALRIANKFITYKRDILSLYFFSSYGKLSIFIKVTYTERVMFIVNNYEELVKLPVLYFNGIKKVPQKFVYLHK